MYTSQLEDYLLQYANRSALEILMHLQQTYGFINPTQLVENYNKMTAPINFQDPIEILFKKIEDWVRYANAGAQPYMEAQYASIAFLLILNTCAIPDACRDWKRRTPMNQTWAEFRREFDRAQREQMIISSTARGAGYHTVNVAGYIAVKHLRVFTPLGVFTFQGTIRSTFTISNGVASAIFTGILPYCFLVFLLNWHNLQVSQWDCTFRVNPGHVIVFRIVASVRVAPG
jgi:hypothetical protein